MKFNQGSKNYPASVQFRYEIVSENCAENEGGGRATMMEAMRMTKTKDSNFPSSVILLSSLGTAPSEVVFLIGGKRAPFGKYPSIRIVYICLHFF